MTVLSPLALWIARRGLRTRQTRKIFRTDTAPALKFKKSINWLMVMMIKGRLFLQIVLINWCFNLNLNSVWKPVAEYDGNKGDPDHEHIQQICWGGGATITSLGSITPKEKRAIFDRLRLLLFAFGLYLGIACSHPFEAPRTQTSWKWSREWKLLWRNSQSSRGPCKSFKLKGVSKYWF